MTPAGRAQAVLHQVGMPRHSPYHQPLLLAIAREVHDAVQFALNASSSARIARHLIDAGGEFKGTQNALAKELGISRSYLCTVLNIWKEDGLVELERRRVIVKNRKYVERFAKETP